MIKYNDYIQLIAKIAHTHSRTRDEFEELFSSGNLAFCESLQSWDRSRGAFSTHLYYTILAEIKKSKRNAAKLIRPFIFQTVVDRRGEFAVDFANSFNALSNDAKELFGIILEINDNGGKITVAKIKEKLREKGWKNKRISAVILEMKSNFGKGGHA